MPYIIKAFKKNRDGFNITAKYYIIWHVNKSPMIVVYFVGIYLYNMISIFYSKATSKQ